MRLGDRESFHFKTGKTGRLKGGDFYLTIDDNGAAQFYANNSGQRGLVDLGDIGKVPLDQVPLPDSGYYQFGIPVAPITPMYLGPRRRRWSLRRLPGGGGEWRLGDAVVQISLRDGLQVHRPPIPH